MGSASDDNERNNLIGRAPKYWRLRLSAASDDEKDPRPFVGWRCALIVESSRQSLYESVLKNGGAQIVNLNKEVSPSQVREISHFFCGNVKAVPRELRDHLRAGQVFSTKHITNTIFRLND